MGAYDLAIVIIGPLLVTLECISWRTRNDPVDSTVLGRFDVEELNLLPHAPFC